MIKSYKKLFAENKDGFNDQFNSIFDYLLPAENTNGYATVRKTL